MKRKIYLGGVMGQQFGTEFDICAESVADAFRCLEANFPTLKEFLIQSHEDGVGFAIEVAGDQLEDPSELLMPMNKGDIMISPVPAGSKSGGAKILAAIVIAALIVTNPV
jgi:predicted phage tail protein